MTWIRLDDEYSDHPKIAAAGPLGQLLHLRAINWAARNLTDGKIPRSTLEVIAYGCLVGEVERPESLDAHKLIARVVDVGLIAENGDGYAVHDFLDYNPSRKQVESDREKERDRKRRQRARGSDG